jgi:DNA polymerase I-like protein with 3'-5' exonuclease and polymerase domains
MDKTLQKSDWSGHLDTDQIEYCARDANTLLYLQPILSTALQSARVTSKITLFDVFKLEMQVLRPVGSMTFNGFSFNVGEAYELKSKLEDDEVIMRQEFLDELDATIADENPDEPSYRLPRDPDGSYNTREKDTGSIRAGTKKHKGFNPRSPQQLADKFSKAGIILPVKPGDKNQKPSLDQTLLAFLRADFFLINQYLEWKAVVTRISAVEKLINSIEPQTKRIHASYRQVGTDTGRLSCAEPNLQQVPRTKDFRSLFSARPGFMLVVGDFSQIELRVAAELSQEPRMIEAYRDGRDLHTETAALMLGKTQEEVTKEERQSAKIANFGLLFGAGAATLRKQAIAQYGLALSMPESKKIVAGFRMAYPRLHDWQNLVGNRDTNAVLTLYGRRRILVGFNDRFTVRINTEVQGTAGDIGKIAMAMVYQDIMKRKLLNKVNIIAMVHDEVVLECEESLVDETQVMLKTNMENAGRILCKSVPIVAEVSSGFRWSDAK